VTLKGTATDPMALSNNEIIGFETAVLIGKGGEKNTVKRLNLRGRRFGIALFNSDDNKVVKNTAANDVPHGIRIDPDSSRNEVKRNIVFQNGGDGLFVENKKTTVKENQATNNQGWGINAVRGVTHSGNRAAGNFGPGQCRNVTCKTATPPA
jgi:parallel beta-helix repeat protein